MYSRELAVVTARFGGWPSDRRGCMGCVDLEAELAGGETIVDLNLSLVEVRLQSTLWQRQIGGHGVCDQ